jgi:hypothetical protein
MGYRGEDKENQDKTADFLQPCHVWLSFLQAQHRTLWLCFPVSLTNHLPGFPSPPEPLSPVAWLQLKSSECG